MAVSNSTPLTPLITREPMFSLPESLSCETFMGKFAVVVVFAAIVTSTLPEV